MTAMFGAPVGALPATFSNPAKTAQDWFGDSVAVSGETVVVGAPGTNTFVGTTDVYKA